MRLTLIKKLSNIFRLKRLVSILSTFALVMAMCVCAFVNAGGASAASVTGADMAAHARSVVGCPYVYGATGPSAFDCSGLIASMGVGGNRTSMMSSSPKVGSISSLPDIPGLGLYMPGHVGVYVGGGMAVDARDESSGVCLGSVSFMPWTNWFYISGVSYGSAGESSETSSYSAPRSSQSSSRSTTPATPATPATPTAPKAPAAPVVQYLGCGSSGEAVQALQTRLGELNFYKSSDTGFFGDYTLLCLRNFQSAAGLDVTGEVDSATQRALNSENAPHYIPPTFHLGDTSEEFIKPVQERLVQLEYLASDFATGTFDENTLNAITGFQTAAGLPVTGELDNDTVSVINSENAPMNPKAKSLDMGATGGEVVSLQVKLSQLRYMGDYSSGIYDEPTRDAVMKFQAANSHDVTGIFSRGDKELLNTDKAVKSPDYESLQIGFSGTDVKALQEKLNRLGYYNGNITGYYDVETSEAVKAFENVNGMEITGIATPNVRVSVDAAMNAVNVNQVPDARSGLLTKNINRNANGVNVPLIVTVSLIVIGTATVAVLAKFKRKTLKKVLGLIVPTLFKF